VLAFSTAQPERTRCVTRLHIYFSFNFAGFGSGGADIVEQP
jgi:hypothetical protein